MWSRWRPRHRHYGESRRKLLLPPPSTSAPFIDSTVSGRVYPPLGVTPSHGAQSHSPYGRNDLKTRLRISQENTTGSTTPAARRAAPGLLGRSAAAARAAATPRRGTCWGSNRTSRGRGGTGAVLILRLQDGRAGRRPRAALGRRLRRPPSGVHQSRLGGWQSVNHHSDLTPRQHACPRAVECCSQTTR